MLDLTWSYTSRWAEMTNFTLTEIAPYGTHWDGASPESSLSLFVWTDPYGGQFRGYWIEGPYPRWGERKAEARVLLYMIMLQKRSAEELQLIGPYRT